MCFTYVISFNPHDSLAKYGPPILQLGKQAQREFTQGHLPREWGSQDLLNKNVLNNLLSDKPCAGCWTCSCEQEQVAAFSSFSSRGGVCYRQEAGRDRTGWHLLWWRRNWCYGSTEEGIHYSHGQEVGRQQRLSRGGDAWAGSRGGAGISRVKAMVGKMWSN